MSVIAGLLLALFLLLAALVLLAVLVCLLLVAALALVVLLERTGTDVSTATAGLRRRLDARPDRESADAAASSRLPWSRRKPASSAERETPLTSTPAPAGPAPAPAATSEPADVAHVTGRSDARPAAATPAAAPRGRAVRATTSRAKTAASTAPDDDAPTERPAVVPVEEGAAPATRTRPIRRPKPVVAPEAFGDREAAMDRLFAPLTDSDRTEALPRPQQD